MGPRVVVEVDESERANFDFFCLPTREAPRGDCFMSQYDEASTHARTEPKRHGQISGLPADALIGSGKFTCLLKADSQGLALLSRLLIGVAEPRAQQKLAHLLLGLIQCKFQGCQATRAEHIVAIKQL